MQEWYLGWEKVSCLEKCPQFRGVLIERERCPHFSAVLIEGFTVLYLIGDIMCVLSMKPSLSLSLQE